MSSHLGINEMLALLDRLESAIRTFAAREEKLNGEFRARSSATAKAFEKATEEHASQLAERIAGAEAAFEAEKHKLQSKFERRKSRITQAHRTSTQQVMEGTDRAGRRQHQIQEGSMDTERRRDTELANAAARLENFTSQAGRKPRRFCPAGKNRQERLSRLWQIPQAAFSGPAMAGTGSSRRMKTICLTSFSRLEFQTRDELSRFKNIPAAADFRVRPDLAADDSVAAGICRLGSPAPSFRLARHPVSGGGRGAGGALGGSCWPFISWENARPGRLPGEIAGRSGEGAPVA